MKQFAYRMKRFIKIIIDFKLINILFDKNMGTRIVLGLQCQVNIEQPESRIKRLRLLHNLVSPSKTP